MKHRGFESEKFTAKKEKKEYTRTELKASFKRGMITLLIVQSLVFGVVMYFRTHTITETANGLKSAYSYIVGHTTKS